MTTAPFEPDPGQEEEIAAADPGRGAPEVAPGFGPTAIDPDQVDAPQAEDPDERGGPESGHAARGRTRDSRS